MSEQKRSRRRRDMTGWVVAISVLVAVGCVGAVTALAINQQSAPAPAAVVQAPAAPPEWLADLQAQVSGGRGFDWLELAYQERVAVVRGAAPDARAAQRGFVRAEAALLADPAARDDIDVVVNSIAVEGVESVGAAFSALGANPSVADCQGAFDQTLAGRFVGFQRASAAITRDSAELLNALSAVAIRCRAHRIEVGGHTDLSGSSTRNLILSQERADAVRAYLIERNVPEGQLAAIGYGDEQPLVDARSPEADARNRRIVFTVTAF